MNFKKLSLIFSFLCLQNIYSCSLVDREKFEKNNDFIKRLGLEYELETYLKKMISLRPVDQYTIQDLEEDTKSFLSKKILKIIILENEYFRKIETNGERISLLHLKTIFYRPKDQDPALFSYNIIIDLKGRALEICNFS